MEDEQEAPPLRELPEPQETVPPPIVDPPPQPEPVPLGTDIETPIGPTFTAEVLASDLAGLPFSWGSDGVQYGAAFPPERLHELEALIAAHDPNAPLEEPAR